MSVVELFRIGIPLVVLAMLAAVLVRFVRGRSAARERALTELAARYGLKYAPAGVDFFQGPWPGKVSGSHRGRKLTLQYRDDPYTAPAGYHRANYSAVIEVAIQNPQQGSLALQARRSPLPAGDPFEQRVAVSSKPNAFAAEVLADTILRQRLAAALTQDRTNPGKINVVRTGALVFVRAGVYRRSEDLAALLELLSDLADVIERLPAKN